MMSRDTSPNRPRIPSGPTGRDESGYVHGHVLFSNAIIYTFSKYPIWDGCHFDRLVCSPHSVGQVTKSGLVQWKIDHGRACRSWQCRRIVKPHNSIEISPSITVSVTLAVWDLPRCAQTRLLSVYGLIALLNMALLVDSFLSGWPRLGLKLIHGVFLSYSLPDT